MRDMLIIFDATSLYSLYALGLLGVVMYRQQETKQEVKKRIWIKSCPHCGGDQMLDYEGRMYSTYLVAVKKCLLCSRSEPIIKSKKPSAYRLVVLENRLGR